MIAVLVRRTLPIFLLMSVCRISAQVIISSDSLKLELDKKGFLVSIANRQTGKNYLYAGAPSPLLTLVKQKERIPPTSLGYDQTGGIITLKYLPTTVEIRIRVVSKATHLVFEIIKAIPEPDIDAVIWGPYSLTVQKTVGEVIGVVNDGETSIGIQVLNVKTQGGDYPNSEGSFAGRGIAAKSYSWGSSLQAYSINRNKERYVDAWNGDFKNMPVPAIKGETVVGSKIALFTCSEPKTLDFIQSISIAEKLPYPTMHKIWFKKSPLYGRSYMISSFGEKDVDEMITYAKRAGLMSLYHEGPFKSWGHYILNPEMFPNGKEGIKKCVEKAHAAGLLFGVHTLSNFINTDDSYVTPVPDDRLSVTGYGQLVKAIDLQQKNIEVSTSEYFKQDTNNNLHTVKIDKELIRYKSVTLVAPYTLIDCQRGAFGTTVSVHSKGARVGKLFDHSYQVFFPNFEMQHEIAGNISRFLNETGIDQFDFDGHEGCLASGEGDYAIDYFAKDVYDSMRHEFICGTSNSKTFFWNIGSYYNWGEPWYGGFNESMQQTRIDNQGLFDRNLMPHMLGWYLLGEHTTLPEMETMLAMAAGYNAGFAMVARPKALKTNPQTPQLLDAIREWETARMGKAFNPELQAQLKNPHYAFHLEKTGAGKWNIFQYALSPVLVREKFERQPGEPTGTTWKFSTAYKEQPMQFSLHITGKTGTVSNIKMQFDNYAEINIPVELKAGATVVCDGTEKLLLYDGKGKADGEYKISKPPVISPGAHIIIIENDFGGEESPKIEMQFKGLNHVETVQINKTL